MQIQLLGMAEGYELGAKDVDALKAEIDLAIIKMSKMYGVELLQERDALKTELSQLLERMENLESALKVARDALGGLHRWQCTACDINREISDGAIAQIEALTSELKCGLCTDAKPCNFEACPDDVALTSGTGDEEC
jgi:hypothetical protein